ncbi:MAG: cupin domain-containing protein [Acidobacteria bacterium]|nr:cupin domain-containing protein [Acidobacteriota bacterium]
MRTTALIVCLLTAGAASPPRAQAPTLPLASAGRPSTPGIARTTLRDDAKVTVTRVEFEPGAGEPPHTHATDVILVPVADGPVEVRIGDATLTRLAAGDVQFVGRGVTHSVKYTGTDRFALVAVAVK